MKLTISCLSLYFTSLLLIVQAQTLYPGLSGEELKEALVEDYKPVGILDYSAARLAMFQDIDNRNDTVRGIYSDHGVWLDPEAPDPIQFLLMNNNPDGINTEHIFPQSQGAGSGNARADLHHLFPSRVAVNSARGSFPFAEIEDQQTEHWYYLNQDMTGIPSEMIDLYSEQRTGFFEPREAKKGDVARAMFYFFTMYEESANESYFMSQVETLCHWHVDDPVDVTESARNDAVAAIQEGKHNPFILDCTVVDRTYCAGITSCEPTSVTENQRALFLISPNPATDRMRVDVDGIHKSLHYNVIDLTGRILLKGSLKGEIIDISNLVPGMYILRLFNSTSMEVSHSPFIRM